jgi:hypothetical protein
VEFSAVWEEAMRGVPHSVGIRVEKVLPVLEVRVNLNGSMLANVVVIRDATIHLE